MPVHEKFDVVVGGRNAATSIGREVESSATASLVAREDTKHGLALLNKL
jgi:hypothetical protein